jgi:peptide/nickel transport system ATP-binding protein
VLNGEDLLTKNDADMRDLRGDQVSMIFQEPMTSLNPVFTCGDQIAETVALHMKLGRRQAMERAIEMLRLVGIPDPKRRAREYPHQLSGGMRQRVMIAMALACKPDLLIADEPTTALDVTIQAQILELLKKLQHELGMSILLITHDLGVVAETCDEVCVMYAGRIVERAKAETLFAAPRHHYTAGLIRSIASGDEARLVEIKGMVPALHELPKGCKFADRCPRVEDKCRQVEPELAPLGESLVRCHFPLEAPR